MGEAIYDDIFGLSNRKKSINSKAKGDKNENDLIKSFLSIWTGDKFARTPRSGGLGWKSEVSSGDVVNITSGKDFDFCVETKHYKSVGLRDIELRSNSIIYKFWRQSRRDAYAIDKIPLLAVRENGMKKGEYFIFFDNMCSEIIVKHFGLQYEYKGNADGDAIFGFGSAKLLAKVNYKDFINILRNGRN